MSESGTALHRINQDDGVINNIFLDNEPDQTGYNTKMYRLKRMAIMEVQTTEPYSPWKNKAEISNKTIKVKANRRRVQRNITKRV